MDNHAACPMGYGPPPQPPNGGYEADEIAGSGNIREGGYDESYRASDKTLDSGSAPARRFACHYDKYNECRPFGQKKCCSEYGWGEISRLKEHFKREHLKHEHIKRARGVKTLPDEKWKAIIKNPLVPVGAGEEAKWYAIWDIIFPKTQQPSSPCKCQSVQWLAAGCYLIMEDAFAFRDTYFRFHLWAADPNLVEEVHTALGSTGSYETADLVAKFIWNAWAQSHQPPLPISPHQLGQPEAHGMANGTPLPSRPYLDYTTGQVEWGADHHTAYEADTSYDISQYSSMQAGHRTMPQYALADGSAMMSGWQDGDQNINYEEFNQ